MELVWLFHPPRFYSNLNVCVAGGAAVVCIGNGHPVVKQAIKDQVDKLSCEFLQDRHLANSSH